MDVLGWRDESDRAGIGWIIEKARVGDDISIMIINDDRIRKYHIIILANLIYLVQQAEYCRHFVFIHLNARRFRAYRSPLPPRFTAEFNMGTPIMRV